jgi:nitrite reductase (NO-forming)
MKRITMTLLFGMLTLAPLAAAQALGGVTATKVSVVAGKPSEFKFTLSKTAVPTGAVTFSIVNKGALAHTFKICASAKGGSANSCTGKGTTTIAPGKSASLSYTFKTKGSYEYLCTVPGHAAAGMKGDLKVT